MQENIKQVTVKRTVRMAFRTEPIWQYDVGHELVFDGFELPTAFEVHFSRSPMGQSITQIGTENKVTLPDMYAQSAGTIYAWLYIAGEDTGLTKYSIEIPVNRRARITDQQPTPVEQSAIDQAIAALNAGVDAAEDAQTAAEVAQAAAELAKSVAELEADAAEAAKLAAQEFASVADGSATEAGQSATAAGQSATAAAGSATTASTKAGEADASATAAAQTKAAIDDEVTGFQDQLTDVLSALSQKQDAPQTPGTAGQVLGLDSNLAPVWTDAPGADESGLAPVIKSTASGEIASFADGADGRAIDSLVVNISPVQDLHGQDAPYPPGGGKNLLDISQSETGGIDASGAYASANTLWRGTQYIEVESSENYYFSGKAGTGLTLRICWYDSSKTFIQRDQGNSFTAPATAKYARFTLYRSTEITKQVVDGANLQFEKGSTATAYAPYSNECPISGWTGCEVSRTGRNLLNRANETANKRLNNTGGLTTQSGYSTSDFILVKGGMELYFKDLIPSGIGYSICVYSGNTASTFIQYKNIGTGTYPVSGTWTIPDAANYIRVTYKTDGTPAVLYGTTSYEPYQGRSIPVSWETEAGTVYDGTVDIISGLLTVDMAKKIVTSFGGKFGTALNGNAFYLVVNGGSRTKTSNMNPLCNMFTASDLGYNQMPLYSYKGASGSASTWTFVLPSTVTSTSEANAWLASLPEPIEFTYALETPIVYQLSENELATLLAQNNIFADCGSIASVEYSADTKLYIDNKITQAVAAALNA